MFFVAKKDGSLRLVIDVGIDGREASMLHQRPPHVALGSASALAQIDLSDDVLGADLGSMRPDITGASADLRQGFYQLRWPQVASYFGFDYPLPIEQYGGTCIFDESLGRYVDAPPGTVVFPVFEVLAMGWSWSLYLCNMMTQDCLIVGAARALQCRVDEIGVAAENRPAPRLRAGRCIVASYVDNGNTISPDRRTTSAALSGFLDELRRRNLVYHEVVATRHSLVICGVLFQLRRRRCRPDSRRACRLYLATGELIRLRGASGAAVAVYLGHLTHHFMLLRPALAALDRLYHYSDPDSLKFVRFDSSALTELQTLRGLIFLAGVHMGARWCSVAFCTDACLSGYAVAEARLPLGEVVRAGAVRERWRFQPGREEVAGGSPLQAATLAAAPAVASEFAPLVPLAAPCARYRGRPRPRPRNIEVSATPLAPLSASVVAGWCWQLVVRGAFRHREGIRMLEGRTTLVPLKRASRATMMHGMRILVIGDNLGSLLSYEKGRCTDLGHRRLCRIAAIRQIACGLVPAFRYVESARNPTDEDSRAAERGLLSAGQSSIAVAARLPSPGRVPRAAPQRRRSPAPRQPACSRRRTSTSRRRLSMPRAMRSWARPLVPRWRSSQGAGVSQASSWPQASLSPRRSTAVGPTASMCVCVCVTRCPHAASKRLFALSACGTCTSLRLARHGALPLAPARGPSVSPQLVPR